MEPDERSNPYLPPAGDDDVWDGELEAAKAAPVPTSAPRVLGILSIIFGALTLLTSLGSGCIASFGRQPSFNRLMTQGATNSEAVTAAYEAYYGQTFLNSMIASAIYGLMSLALLIIGIGQVRYRAWARRWSVAWAWSALVAIVGVVLSSLLIAAPANEQLMTALRQAAPSGSVEARTYEMMGQFMSFELMAAMTVVLMAPYPVLLLIYFSRARVKAAMVR